MKRRESTHCDLVIITRNAADAQSDTTNTVTGLHQETVSFYHCIRCGVDGALVKVRRRLTEVFDCEARSLQQSVCKAVCRAAEGTCKSFTNAPVAIDKRLRLAAG